MNIKAQCVINSLKKIEFLQKILSNICVEPPEEIFNKLIENNFFSKPSETKTELNYIFRELETHSNHYDNYLQLFQQIITEKDFLIPFVIESAFKPILEEFYGLKIPSFLIIRDLLDQGMIDPNLVLNGIKAFPNSLPNQFFLLFYIFKYFINETSDTVYSVVTSSIFRSFHDLPNGYILNDDFIHLMQEIDQQHPPLTVSLPFIEIEFLSIAANDNVEEYIKYGEMNKSFENIFYKKEKSKIFMPFALSEAQKQSEVLAYIGATKCMEYLISSGICIPSRTSKEQFFAVAGGSKEMCELLDTNGFQFTDCLPIAAFYHQNEIFDLIVAEKRTLIPNFIREINKCIIECAKTNNVPVCLKCLEFKGKFNYKDILMRTALSYAAESGANEILRLALAHEPDLLSEVDSKGRIPLHYAYIQSKYDSVETIMKYSFDCEEEDYCGMTPIQYCGKEFEIQNFLPPDC